MIKMIKLLRIFVSISFFLTSTIGFSIDLNTKIQNVDKTDFNSISSPFLNGKEFVISSELLNSVNPLVLKRNDGTTVPLIQGLTVFELSFLFGITESLQLGILIPGENPYGIIGSYDEAKKYLTNILIEPKIYLSEGIALIPLYYIPGSEKVYPEINNTKTELNLGKSKGAYGAKLVFGFGDKSKNETLTAIQIGAIIAPEEKFREIDQTTRIQLGGGVSYPLTGTLRLLFEAYAEKTKNNNPIEALATIEYKNDNFMMRIGGGNGDIQGSGSNTSKLLANFTYYFGDKKKVDQKNIENKKEEKSEELEFKKEEKKNNFENDPIEEQTSPTFSKSDAIIENDLIISKKIVPLEKRSIPIPSKPKTVELVYIILNDRKKDKVKNTDRFPANDDSIDPLIERHSLNIKKSIQLLENNIFLYQKYLLEKNEEKVSKLKKEIIWGIRVYKKNIKALNDLNKNEIALAYNFNVDIIEKILNENFSNLPTQSFLVNVSKLNSRSQDFISKNNIVYQMNKNDEVYIIGESANNGFVQVKPINGDFANYKYPLFVGKKYLTKKIVLTESSNNSSTPIDPKTSNVDPVVLNKNEDIDELTTERTPSVNTLELPKKKENKNPSYLFPIKLNFENSNEVIETKEIKENKIEESNELQIPKNKVEIVEEVIKEDSLKNKESEILSVKSNKIEIVEEPIENKITEDSVTKENLPVELKKQLDESIKEQVNEDTLLKEKEIKKVDELFFELKSKAKNEIKFKEPIVKKEENSSEKQNNEGTFKELIKKSNEGLQEESPIEEQNGPSFGDI